MTLSFVMTSFMCTHFSLLLFFIVVLSGGILWHLQKFLHYINYITLEFTLSTIFLYSLPHTLLEYFQ